MSAQIIQFPQKASDIREVLRQIARSMQPGGLTTWSHDCKRRLSKTHLLVGMNCPYCGAIEPGEGK